MFQIAVGQILLVRIACYTPTQVGINTLYYRVLNVTANMTAHELAQAISATIASNYLNVLSDDARFRGVSVQRLVPGPLTVAAVDTTNDAAGTVVSEALPGQVSGLIAWQTVLAGAAGRGRIYVPFPAEVDSEAGVPTANYITRLQTLGNSLGPNPTFDLAGEVANLQLLVWDRENGIGTDVAAVLARKQWATQRKRGGYGQRNLPPF